jgi:hypothetical protein
MRRRAAPSNDHALIGKLCFELSISPLKKMCKLELHIFYLIFHLIFAT